MIMDWASVKREIDAKDLVKLEMKWDSLYDGDEVGFLNEETKVEVIALKYK